MVRLNVLLSQLFFCLGVTLVVFSLLVVPEKAFADTAECDPFCQNMCGGKVDPCYSGCMGQCVAPCAPAGADKSCNDDCSLVAGGGCSGPGPNGTGTCKKKLGCFACKCIKCTLQGTADCCCW